MDYNILNNSEYVTTGGAEEPSPMQHIIAAIIILIIILVLAYYFKLNSALRAKVKSISDAGWVVYYSDGCGFCGKQKELLPGVASVKCNIGGRPTDINLNGADPPLACDNPIITGFPFWYNTKTKETKVGVQQF